VTAKRIGSARRNKVVGRGPADGGTADCKMKEGARIWRQGRAAVDLDKGAVVAVTLQGADKATRTRRCDHVRGRMAVAEQVGRETSAAHTKRPR